MANWKPEDLFNPDLGDLLAGFHRTQTSTSADRESLYRHARAEAPKVRTVGEQLPMSERIYWRYRNGRPIECWARPRIRHTIVAGDELIWASGRDPEQCFIDFRVREWPHYHRRPIDAAEEPPAAQAGAAEQTIPCHSKCAAKLKAIMRRAPAETYGFPLNTCAACHGKIRSRRFPDRYTYRTTVKILDAEFEDC